MFSRESEISDVYIQEFLAHNLPKNTLPYAYSKNDDKTDLRDVLDSELKKMSAGTRARATWSNEPWDHVATFKKAAMGSGHVQKTRFKPFRVVNYKACHWMHSKGMVYQSVDGSTAYKSRIHCGEKVCLLCDMSKRKRQGLKAVSELKALFAGMPGAPGILFIDFTLPRHLESLPLHDTDLEKSLKNEIHKIIKNLFGCNSRSNIGLRLSVHAVGSRDIMRDRWHCHVDIIPGEVIKDKSAELKFHWLDPVHYRQDINKWIIDLQWLNQQWHQALINSGLDPGGKLANPEVKFCKYPKEVKEQKPFWKKITHKLTYNLRSMAQDLEKTFLRSDFSTARMIIKGASGNVGYWYILEAGSLVDRFAFIRSKTLFRKRGFLSCLKKYSDLVILEGPPEENSCLDCLPPVDAEITTVYEKQYNSDLKHWITLKVELWRWKCPITGADRRAGGHELKPWKTNQRC